MKIVSPENTIWQRHYHNGVSYTDRALRVVDLTEYPAKSPIMVSQTGANLYYNPQTSGLYLSDRFLDVDYYVQPQIDIVEWLARATAAKVRGLI